jgi:hypothetical protein
MPGCKWHLLLLVACIGAGFATGCASTGVARRTVPFNTVDFAAYSGGGSGVVAGQCFLKSRQGDVKKGAGELVYLVPVTPYTQEWWTRSALGGERLSTPDPTLLRYVKITTADGEGLFRFDQVAPGRYYVVSEVTWQTADDFHLQGGMVGSPIDVGAGQTATAMLSVLLTQQSPGPGLDYRQAWASAKPAKVHVPWGEKE